MQYYISHVYTIRLLLCYYVLCITVVKRPASMPIAFPQLVQTVQSCRQCPRMEGRTRVLSHANGNLQARILFVAEAPGRLGADKTGIPLSNDQSGRNFDKLLAAAKIDRADIFITNAVLCNPRDLYGNNAAPTRREMHNCSPHLAATIDLIKPGYVVSLGVKALYALGLVEPHSATLAANVGQPLPWHNRTLIPLYHPGPRAMIHRPMDTQVQDYCRLSSLIHNCPGEEP